MRPGRTIVLLMFAFVVAAAAQMPGDIVQWTARTASARVRAGQKLTVVLSAKIADGWHVYSITQGPGGPTRTEISVPAGQVLKAAEEVTGPKPHSAYDSNFQMKTEFYAESATFQVPLRVEALARPGPAQGTINVRFQACNDNTCLPPTRINVPLALTIAGGATAKPAGR